LCVCFRIVLFYDLYCVNLTSKIKINNSVADWCHLASAAGTVLGRIEFAIQRIFAYAVTIVQHFDILPPQDSELPSNNPNLFSAGAVLQLDRFKCRLVKRKQKKCHHKYGQKSLLPKKTERKFTLTVITHCHNVMDFCFNVVNNRNLNTTSCLHCHF